MIADWSAEQQAYAKGFRTVCGIDEAGRGPLAGPVVAAAVILPADFATEELDDSKKLTPKKREQLYYSICAGAVAWAVGSADPQTIDAQNILQATFLAMRRAVRALVVPADFALVDGNQSPMLTIPDCCIVGGDAKVPSIAAASVVAKVTRDRYMCREAIRYPQYGFDKHKGYGTKAHYAALDAYGICPLHRRSFLRKYFAARAKRQ